MEDRREADGSRIQGRSFPKGVILHAVFFYVRYPVSYRELQEILAERGIVVDHATLSRWVIRYSSQIAAQSQMRKRPTVSSWRVDETHLKVRGKWVYLYRAIDRDGQTLDFMLSERRDLAAARRFFQEGHRRQRRSREGCYRQERSQSVWLAGHEHNPEIHRNGRHH